MSLYIDVIKRTPVYGIEIDLTSSSTVLSRVGSIAGHQKLPVQSGMKRCLLKEDGVVNYYLHPTDSTKKSDGTAANLTGTEGQVMTEIPACYLKVTILNSKVQALISEQPFSGATKFKKRWVSAYEATVERSTVKMASVVNLTDDFRGGNNTALMNGMPISSVSRATARGYARARGSVNWNILDYSTDCLLTWLYFIEYANTNIQMPFNAALTTEGYRQGGLGDGVTTVSDSKWSAYNGYYPFIPCGHTNSLGNNSAEKAFVIPNFNGVGVNETVMVPSYRGIENIFGHIFGIIDGIQAYCTTAGENPTSFQAFITDDPTLFNDNNNTGMRFAGNLPVSSGFISELSYSENGDILPKSTTGGSATSYMADYFYAYTSVTEYKWYCKGGVASNGANAGLGCARATARVSAAHANYGFRLCYLS